MANLCRVYSPPFDEFEVSLADLPGSAKTILPANPGPQIMLVMRGEGSASAYPPANVDVSTSVAELEKVPHLSKGDVFLVPAGEISISTLWGDVLVEEPRKGVSLLSRETGGRDLVGNLLQNPPSPCVWHRSFPASVVENRAWL